jgi:hypothetical protein
MCIAGFLHDGGGIQDAGICKMRAGFTRRGIYKMRDLCGIFAESLRDAEFSRGMRNLYKMRNAGCGIFCGISCEIPLRDAEYGILVECGIFAGFKWDAGCGILAESLRDSCGMRN